MHIQQFLGFAAVSLSLALVPGPSWFFAIATTLEHGRRAGLVAVVGNAVGIAGHVLAVAAGLAALLDHSPQLFAPLRWIGALYLIYLGIRTILRGTATADAPSAAQTRSPGRVFVQGVLVNLLNPKVALVMLALLPQFADPELGRVPAQIFSIGLLHPLIASSALVLVVVFAGGAERGLRDSPHLLSRLRTAAGLALILAGLLLAVTGPG